MKLIEAPNMVVADRPIVFLAGSIEMGEAADWQQEVIVFLGDRQITVLNPRRKHWNKAEWEKKDNAIFQEQVKWELDGLEMADIIVYYFDPKTKSPITLMELGLYATSGKKILVCCPEGFWKKGNVDIVCERFGLRQCATLTELIIALRIAEEQHPRS